MEDLSLIEFLPNVEDLFKIYNEKYFNNILIDVKLEWSEKMTRCAGICMLKPGRIVIIRLSRPLLQLRPFSDTINTLLHEMIHAYFFILQGGSMNRDGHGPDFCEFMDRINAKESTQISIYHTFHDEVDHYKKHIWRCNGPCRNVPPFFGWVKRSMNRKPQPADSWWNNHQASCNGTFIKVSEPEQAENSSKITPFKGKGRTCSEPATKMTDFFLKKVKTEESHQKLKCINCPNFETESLQELNDHLDICLDNPPDLKNKRVIDLT